MAAYSKQLLSSSSQGKPIQVGTSQTLIHATGTSATILDEVWIFASNPTTGAVVLTVSLGPTGVANSVTQSLAAKSGLVMIVPGQPLIGTGSAGTSAMAYADIASSVSIAGWVNRVE